MIDSQAEKLKELDKEIRPFRQNWEEADSMKSSVESLQNRVTELESVDKSAGQAARNTGEGGRDLGGDVCLRPLPGPQVGLWPELVWQVAHWAVRLVTGQPCAEVTFLLTATVPTKTCPLHMRPAW